LSLKDLVSAFTVLVLVLVFIVFIGFEVLLWLGILPPQNNATGLFANLLYAQERFLENPFFVAILATFIVNFFGWLANTFRTGEIYEPSRLLETWAIYEPLLILWSQAFPMREALAFTLAIDVTRRILIAVAKVSKSP